METLNFRFYLSRDMIMWRHFSLIESLNRSITVFFIQIWILVLIRMLAGLPIKGWGY